MRAFGRLAGGITGRIMLLVIAAIVTMAAVIVVVTFSGPPPFPRPIPVGAVVDAVNGVVPSDARHRRERARLVVTYARQAPHPAAGQISDSHVQNAIAYRMNIPAGDILYYSDAFNQIANHMGGNWDGPGPMRGNVGRNDRRGPMPLFIGGFNQNFTLAVKRGATWTIVRPDTALHFTDWHKRLLIWLGVAMVALSLIGIALSRAISGPIEAIVSEAERSGVAGPPIAIQQRGPTEVAKLGGAINDMRARYAAAVESRTEMLVGIAHDLGTPLSRLAFRAEFLPEGQREDALRDIDEMRALIHLAMDFARDSHMPDTVVAFDALIRERVATLSTATAPVTIDRLDDVQLRGNAIALARLVDNLIHNAQRYAGAAQISLIRSRHTASLIVCDDGPGFDPVSLPKIFEPFYRGESSRNRATGGNGMGLAIARNIADAHGGSIYAENRDPHGAMLLVRLPVWVQATGNS